MVNKNNKLILELIDSEKGSLEIYKEECKRLSQKFFLFNTRSEYLSFLKKYIEAKEKFINELEESLNESLER